MGFWVKNIKKYFKRKVKIRTKQQILRFNYDNHLNNSKTLFEINNYMIEQIHLFGREGNKDYLNIHSFNFSEKDVEKYFFAQDHDILNLIGFLPIFMVYGLGIVASLVVFCVEILYFRFKK